MSKLLTPPPAPHLLLVGCGQRKLPHPAPARDLYTGSLFLARRRYAESSGTPWLICSSLHGIVAPNAVIKPYEQSNAGLSTAARRQWALRVYNELVCNARAKGIIGLAGVPVIYPIIVELHMGAAYAEPLLALRFTCVRFVWPVKGLTQGRHLQFYSTQATR